MTRPLRTFPRKFAGRRVLVIGDMVADEYVVGSPVRISREAPVLILHHSRDFVCPGGAANVAANLASLGAEAQVAGVIGSDEMGSRLQQELRGRGICTSGLIVDSSRPTATKTRVVGRGDQEMQQQIVRIDRVDDSPVEGLVADKLLQVIRRLLASTHAVVISDYENGVIGPEVLAEVLPAGRKSGRLTTVDSHGDLFRFRGVTVATPNQPEAEATLQRRIRSVEELEEAGDELRTGMQARGILITRGSQGMSLFEEGRPPLHLPPTNLREVFDPTGAGDTACAVFTLALLADAPMHAAAELSNIAAGEVVKSLGAATLTPSGLEEAMPPG